LVDLLATQVPYSSEAKNSGFDIMAQIEGAVNDVPATAGDPAAGSDLVNHLLLCMYDPAPDKELSKDVSGQLQHCTDTGGSGPRCIWRKIRRFNVTGLLTALLGPIHRHRPAEGGFTNTDSFELGQHSR
jgi:hypothetical protein